MKAMIYKSSVVGLAVLLLAGCAGTGAQVSSSGERGERRSSGEEARVYTPAPVGEWTYEADSPQGMYRGTLTITETPDGELAGEIMPADDPSGSLEVENLSYEGGTLTFDLVGGEYGDMAASVEVGSESFEGTIEVPRYGVTMPFTGERQDR